jgi:hypothetical protein
MLIYEWWIGKDLEGSGRGIVLRHYPDSLLEGLGKTTRNLSQDGGLRAEIWTRDLQNT